MIYGHFIEHFHRQIYGGIFDPENRLSDEDGFRRDVIDAMKKIKVPVLRYNRNCDIIGMANFAPVVNTRGCIFTYRDGIVLRPTWHVFDLYVNELSDTVLDTCVEEMPLIRVREKGGGTVETGALDLIGALDLKDKSVTLAAVNKDPQRRQKFQICWTGIDVPSGYSIKTLSGNSTESCNDIMHTEVKPVVSRKSGYEADDFISLPPHSVNIVRFVP
jgi:alpha-N-arabinofuranosidase